MSEEARPSGGGGAQVLIGCGVALLVTLCFGPTLIGLGAGMFARSVSVAPTGPPPPPPASAGEGGPHMPLPPGAVIGPVGVANVSLALTVDGATGRSGVAAGDSCTLDFVYDTSELGLQCHASLSCGSLLVYGGTSQGYFPCDPTPGSDGLHTGIDGAPTSEDGDPRFWISSERVEVSDDAEGPLGEMWISFVRPL
jgi:hypothetical protein